MIPAIFGFCRPLEGQITEEQMARVAAVSRHGKVAAMCSVKWFASFRYPGRVIPKLQWKIRKTTSIIQPYVTFFLLKLLFQAGKEPASSPLLTHK